MMRLRSCVVWVLMVVMMPLPTLAEVVEIVTFDYPPMTSQDDPDGGLMGKIVKEAFRESQLDIRITYYPPARVLKEHVGGTEYAACLCPEALVKRLPVEKISDVIVFPPFIDIIMVFFYYTPHHGDKPISYNELAELKSYHVGVIRGSNTTVLLTGAGILIQESAVDSQIKKLKAGRIDYAAMGILTGMEMIQRLYPAETDHFSYMAKPIMELPTTICFNKKVPGSVIYREKFEKGFNTMIANGSYIRLLESYYGVGLIPHQYKPLFERLGVAYTFGAKTPAPR